MRVPHNFQQPIYACLSQLLVCMSGLVVLCSIISCGCNSKPIKQSDNDTIDPLPSEQSTQLAIKLQPTMLVGDKKTTEAIFTLDGSDTALLEDFALKAS